MLFENSSSIQSFQNSGKKASARHIHHHLFPVIGPKMHFSESHKNISREALQENQVPVYNVYPKQCAFRQTHPLKTTQTVQKIQNVPKRSLSCFPVHSSAQKIPKQ